MVVTERELAARLAQCADRLGAELQLLTQVVGDDVCALCGAETRSRDSAPAEADDEDALSVQVRVHVHHRSFSVASVAMANMIEMIQKRTMIFGSAQPFFSKW